MKELIEKSEQLTALLKELDTSVTAEKHKYVVKWEHKMGQDDVYSMKDNITGEVKLDKLSRIMSWLHIRNIDKKEVFYI